MSSRSGERAAVSTIVVFAEDEKIETVALGDLLAWQAVPDQSKRYLFIKPLEKGAATNMTVVTRKRIYSFILRADAPGAARRLQSAFHLSRRGSRRRLMEKPRRVGRLPNMRSARRKIRHHANFDYSYKGQRHRQTGTSCSTMGPRRIFASRARFPEFSSSMPIARETLMNYRREGEMIVVDKTAGQWTMRNGDETACVFNLRAEKRPEPKTRESDVQADLQGVHAPEEKSFLSEAIESDPLSGLASNFSSPFGQ